MPVFKVHVKWGKEKFENVECNVDEPPMLFKAQLFALSGVQPDRQKVMVKGAVLKDEDWGKVKIKDGSTLLMMGSVDELPKEPALKTVFMEDMSEQQLANALDVPAGLTNLGNTCYLNATLQCLRSVPELRDALKSYTGRVMSTPNMEPDQSITAAIRDLFMNLEKTGETISPIIMLHVLHVCFPHFAEKTEHGVFQQQDANECWTELVRCLQRKLPGVEDSQQGGAASTMSFMDQYFSGVFANTMKCIESEDEIPAHSTETFYQLSCFIEKEVKYLHTGLRSKLEEHITKHSSTLDRDAQYLKSSKLRRIPAYLTIQMVRFFYKEKESVNAKILKDIKFPLSLDVFDLCTEELQQKLIPMREKFKEDEERKLAQAPKKNDKQGLKVEIKDDKSYRKEPFSFPDDIGSNNSGYYELQAVLTHKGRSSSSGHYVGWVKKQADEWIMFDDDRVTGMLSEDVLKLSGGGDWHCAYVLLYGPRILQIDEEQEAMEKEKGQGETPMESTPSETTETT